MDGAGSIHDFAGAIFAGTFAAAAAAYTAGVAGPRASRRRSERDAAAAALPALAPWQLVTDEDLACVERCRATLARVARPIYSDFLVAAVLAYEDEHGTTRYVDGCNTETAVLPSSICAERCALLQLRLKAPRFRVLKGVYISTFSGADERAVAEADAAAAAGLPPPRTGYAPVLITPGLLCREMLSGFPAADGGLRVFLFTHDWAPAGDPSTGRHSSRDDARGRHAVYRMADLYPLPHPYNGVPRASLLTHAAALTAKPTYQPFAAPHVDTSGLAFDAGSSAAGTSVEAALLALYASVTACARSCGDPSDQLYPVHLAAGVLLSDGSTSVAREDKGLEFGCTVEAPVKLIPFIQAAATATATTVAGAPRPLVVLQADQFGVLHAPPARARAWLYERGHGGAVVFAHDAATGALVRVTAARLSPAVPRIQLSPSAAGSTGAGDDDDDGCCDGGGAHRLGSCGCGAGAH